MSSSPSACVQSSQSSPENFVLLQHSQAYHLDPMLPNQDGDRVSSVFGSQSSSPVGPGPESYSSDLTMVPGHATHHENSTPTLELSGRRKTRATRKRSRPSPHAKIEQRYRQKLSDNLLSLAEILPNGTYQPSGDMEDMFKRSSAGSKAAIIDAATRYITETWISYKEMAKGNIDLADRTNEMRKLALCEDCSVQKLVAGYSENSPAIQLGCAVNGCRV
jgi:hypothetical protein